MSSKVLGGYHKNNVINLILKKLKLKKKIITKRDLK